jgi:hypothetical protein
MFYAIVAGLSVLATLLGVALALVFLDLENE